jgi:hypothetical protein
MKLQNAMGASSTVPLTPALKLSKPNEFGCEMHFVCLITEKFCMAAKSISKFFQESDHKPRFFEAIGNCYPNLAAEAISAFDNRWDQIRFNTYISSISEHNSTEDLHGRLSMWRAFGGTGARVALVFQIPMNSEVTESFLKTVDQQLLKDMIFSC